ncbi:uncharacterized protein H6S33_001125 [Morchella sextelata]|uniref:uncharacterized protein n=1 Tax=Morchella sextelata TaxID=1174677 RepID=UPI001D05BF84|nr:uncharacterized protein H6S33_001125 [Morchella sextelata]KAH0608897.1 hypothetical protein H6S33_001125 [Morchella sextelata]
MADSKLQQAPFVKQLAANDRPTRDKAVASLRSYLSSQRNFTQIELLKLWKGLFYCMWLSDRPRTQQRLAADLAELLTPMEEKNFVLFLEAFWITMVREWNGIDVLRMDKFLLLVRMYLASSFRYLRGRNWDAGLVESVVKVMKEVPLNPTDNKVPNGLRFHLTDIFVDELEKLSPEHMKDQLPVEQLVEPFQILSVKSPTKMVRVKAKELLLDGRLANWGFEKAPEGEIKKKVAQTEPEGEDEDEEMEDEEWGGIDD